MSNNIKDVKATEVSRLGDWVIPVDNNGVTVYALQINKTQEEKDNFATIYAEYQKAGVEVLTYSGKNDLPVYLVDATQKIKKQRTGIDRETAIETAQEMFGIDRENAIKFVEKMAANKAAKKANK